MSIFFHHFLIGAAGAAAFEALKLWEIQAKLKEKKFRRLLRSTSLWIPLTLMLAASGFFAWAFYEAEPAVKTWNLVMVGVTARTLVREAISVGLAHSRVKLGGGEAYRDERRPDSDAVDVRDFFL